MTIDFSTLKALIKESVRKILREEWFQVWQSVIPIAVAGKASQNASMKKAAKRAITVLKGMTMGVGKTTKFVEACCNELLPTIDLFFGL